MTAFKSLKTERIGGHDRAFGLGDDAFGSRQKALNLAEFKAIGFLRGTEIARRASAENWAVGLIDFAIREGRAPDPGEELEIIGRVRANDVDVRDLAQDAVGNALRNLRDLMHETAERKLRAA